MLFDKLESNKECSKLLSRTLRGQIVWRTRSTETPYKSDREENFYMITVEVKVRTSYSKLYDFIYFLLRVALSIIICIYHIRYLALTFYLFFHT